MSGSTAGQSPLSTGPNAQNAVDSRLTSLTQRPAAADFRALCEDPDVSEDAFAFVHNDAFTARDVTDAFLVDQHFRWPAGRGLPAEAYCRVLRRQFETRFDDLEWELVEQEFLLRLAITDAAAPEVSDFKERFPELEQRIESRFGASAMEATLALEPTETLEEGDAGTIADGLARTFYHTDRKLTRTLKQDVDGDGSSLIVRTDAVVRSTDSVLGQSRPFAKLDRLLISEIERQLRPREYGPGDYLMRQGELGDGLFLVTTGQVEIQVTDKDGNTHVIAASGSGEILGEMALITEEPRTADVIAIGEVSAKFLPVKAFDELAGEHPVISRVLTQLLGERLGMRGRDVLAGKTMEGYRILRRLGKGGMAIVYQAENEDDGQDVALKMMSHRLVYDSSALELFQQESRIIESFNHPHIVRMYGRFKAFRSYFIVLEYCDGISLDQTIRHRVMPEDEFRTVLGQLASALAYAHERNIVHRDIKPSNVMLTRSEGVKLMDFGLANPVDEAEATGVVAGTPRYMAPEQLRGEAVDTRADLFALGVTAWKLLMGDDLIIEASLAEIKTRHANWQVPEIDCTDPEVRDFIRTCLQADPNDRDVDLKKIAEWAQ